MNPTPETPTNAVHTCAKCGRTLHNKPHHIEGIGYLGPECYKHVAGLEQLLENKFNRWLPDREAQAFKRQLRLMGIKYDYQVSHKTDACFFTFQGFKRASGKPKGQVLTFSQIRQQFADKLRAASEARQLQGVAA